LPGAHLVSLLQRDARDYANVDGLYDMPRLVSLLAARASAPLNMAEVSRATGIARSFRASVGLEVDLVLETPDQRIVGVEVKASASITQGDFKGLRELRNAAGKAFVRGVVLYTGEQLMPFEEHLWAVPMGVLWSGGAARHFSTRRVFEAPSAE